MICTLILETNLVIRQGLINILSKQEGIGILGEATNTAEALAFVEKNQPSLMILDLAIPFEDGLSLISKIKKVSQDIRIIIFSDVSENSKNILGLIELGVSGFVQSNSKTETLLEAVREVVNGNTYLFPPIALGVIKRIFSQNSTVGMEFLNHLNSLNLARKHLTDLPLEICQLINLTSLDLSNNKLTTLPAEIGKLANLTSLNLSGNRLKTLPAEISKFVKLDSLNAHGNQLNFLPPEIGSLNNLRVLNLSSNDFTHLQIELSRLSKLEELYLNFNRLLTLPHEIVQLKNLKVLEIIKNNLMFIQSTIGRLENIRELKLGGNPFKSIPSEIGDLINLEKLYLSRTQIKELPSNG